MDGVLVSSIGSVERCWRRWAKIVWRSGCGEYEVPHGRRAIDIVRMLRPDIDAEEGLRVIEDMEVEDVADLRVLPGVKEAAGESAAGAVGDCDLGVRGGLLLARLTAAGLPVPERIISGEMVERGKPDPEPYRRGAELLGF